MVESHSRRLQLLFFSILSWESIEVTYRFTSVKYSLRADVSNLIVYNREAVAGVAELADAHV